MLGIVGVLGVVAFSGVAPAWWIKGHESITEAAASQLPEDVPAFFRNGGKALAHFAGDPDRWKNRDCKALRASIEADHYLDLEDLEGEEFPRESRYKGVEWLAARKKEPSKVGMLPYAVQEGYERLACAFADHRKDPENEAIKMKCLVYAGNLAHFTTDASMPLHSTIHFDGRVVVGTPEKKQKGIHSRLDGFPEKFKLTPEEICRGIEVRQIDDVWAYTFEFMKHSFTFVDASYEFDAAGAFEKPTDDSRAFVLARCKSGAQFTMNVWYAAWKFSAKLPPPY